MSPTVVRLRDLRLAQHLSQAELGRRAKVRQATISALESGKTRRLDLAVLDRLAAALKVQAVALLGWEPGAPARRPSRKPRRPRRR